MHRISKTAGKTIFSLMLILFFLTAFFSCSSSSTKKSFTENLKEVDALIKQGFFSDALEELESIESLAHNSWTQLGIFRRYLKLSEKEKAEVFLKKSCKKNPENIELAAVLCNFYINENRYEDAVKSGSVLKGSKFGSLYSEALFRKLLASDSDMAQYYSQDLYDAYYDAWNGSENQKWLINCALLKLISGNYDTAAKICPDFSENILEPYFWMLVMYDSANYGETVYFADKTLELIEKKSVSESLKSQVVALKADSYAYLMDQNSSEETRRKYLDEFKNEKDKSYSSVNKKDSVMPGLFTNSAVWAIENENFTEAQKLLLTCTDCWPDYVPGLTVYADLAWKTNQPHKENSEQLKLRDYGMATLAMEKYDRQIKIPLSDAVVRVNNSLKRTKDPELYILSMDLKYKMNSKMNLTEKFADIYKILEENQIQANVYPDEILNYSLRFLTANGRAEEARDLLYRHISAKYNIPMNKDFWRNVILKLKEIDYSQVEFLAYYAAQNKRCEEAVRLYEYCVFEADGTDNGAIISPIVSDMSCINLGAVYYGAGEKQKALDLYNKLTGRITDLHLKSIVFYRISRIHFEDGNLVPSRVNAEYAASLDSNNVQAKLILNQIENKKRGLPY